MQRITIRDLEKKIEFISEITGKTHFWAGAYGGYKLEREGKHGGVNDVLNIGFVPKRKLYEHLVTLIKGLIIGKSINNNKR